MKCRKTGCDDIATMKITESGWPDKYCPTCRLGIDKNWNAPDMLICADPNHRASASGGCVNCYDGALHVDGMSPAVRAKYEAKL